MIRSVPNPPMDASDIDDFRHRVKRHLRKDYTPEEKKQIDVLRRRATVTVKKIIANCGGKNPLLRY